MTQEQCAKANCPHFINNADLRRANRRNGNKDYPLDVPWKNCLQGKSVWQYCKKRLGSAAPEPPKNVVKCFRCGEVLPDDKDKHFECEWCDEVFCGQECRDNHEKAGLKECSGMESESEVDY